MVSQFKLVYAVYVFLYPHMFRCSRESCPVISTEIRFNCYLASFCTYNTETSGHCLVSHLGQPNILGYPISQVYSSNLELSFWYEWDSTATEQQHSDMRYHWPSWYQGSLKMLILSFETVIFSQSAQLMALLASEYHIWVSGTRNFTANV